VWPRRAPRGARAHTGRRARSAAANLRAVVPPAAPYWLAATPQRSGGADARTPRACARTDCHDDGHLVRKFSRRKAPGALRSMALQCDHAPVFLVRRAVRCVFCGRVYAMTRICRARTRCACVTPSLRRAHRPNSAPTATPQAVLEATAGRSRLLSAQLSFFVASPARLPRRASRQRAAARYSPHPPLLHPPHQPQQWLVPSRRLGAWRAAPRHARCVRRRRRARRRLTLSLLPFRLPQQVHRRQGAPQAAGHQGGPQVRARHRRREEGADAALGTRVCAHASGGAVFRGRF
jgi:hypothetical protein